jgi:branched-chain amino acid transport system substrate-binding protein
MNSIPRLLLSAVLTALVALSGGSCTTKTTTNQGAVALNAESRTHASQLFEQAKDDRAAGNLDAAALAARELVNNYTGFAMIDQATYLGGEIAFEREHYDEAAAYFDAVAKDFPLSPLRPAAALYSARSYEELAMYPQSAETLIQLLESPIDEGLREAAEVELRLLVRTHLGPSDLESLAQKYPSSPINREIAVRLARQEYARGDYDAAYDMLAEYLYRFPEDSQSSEARLLLKLAAEMRQAPVDKPFTVVEPNTLGAILPVTGPGQLSLFARYFDEGLRLAVDEFNRTSSRQARLVTADTKGTAVGAVKAARKLVLEDGAVGLVGSVFTMPTIAAAIEANAWRTPLLSPVVSADDLLEIGPWIFETKIPQEVEVAAIAAVAVTGLLIERIAIVAPSRGRRRDAADLFAAEATRFGAEVVEVAYYEEGATDFREQLEAVREAAPDAIFLPGGVEELLNLLPQVKFYDLQVQLLGLSNWNNDNLLRLFRNELEGALFPLESYHGKDPVAYQRLKTTLEEKGAGEVNPVTVAGYFGMKLMLESFAFGASNREEVREYLNGQLNQGAETRMKEAEALTILTVRSGRVREFEPPPRPQTGY